MLSFDLPLEAYLASERVSHHKLKTFAEKGPQGYYRRHIQRTWTQDDTKAFVAGRAAEDAVQRPDEYRARYIAKPEGMSFATKDGKAWRAEQEAKGLTIVEGEDARSIDALLESLGSCPRVQSLISACAPQVSIVHDSAPEWGVPGVQSRPDWLCLDGSAASEWQPYAADMKTTATIRKLASGRAVVDYGYHCQAAMVRMCLAMQGVDVSGFRYFLIGAEKAFPYRWQAVELAEEFIDAGERWCTSVLAQLGAHYTSSEWPLVTSEIVVAHPPAWLDDSEAA